MTKLAYSLNVSVLARNFERTEFSRERIICAFVTNGKGNSCIFYSDNLPYKEARIIIFKAFAKYIITGNNNFFVKQSTDFSKKEKMLTAELLMPKSRVVEVICQLILPSTVVLADIFQVTEKFVKHRLAENCLAFVFLKFKTFTPGTDFSCLVLFLLLLLLTVI